MKEQDACQRERFPGKGHEMISLHRILHLDRDVCERANRVGFTRFGVIRNASLRRRIEAARLKELKWI
jgi:hypothetical protein